MIRIREQEMTGMASLIYVVEDDQNIREIESFALKNSGYIVESFDCGKTFFNKVHNKVPDLVLLDIMLPDIDGLEILKRMKSDFELCNIPVIMVTAKSSEIDKVKGLDQGADDYMTKPFGVMELISRVKAVLRRSRNTSDEKIFKAGDIIINEERHAVYVNDEPVELTFKEYNLLKLLISNYGIVMSREVIMDRIWGTSFEGESRTLDMHIKTLRKKLGESGSMIKTVRNVGYAIGLD